MFAGPSQPDAEPDRWEFVSAAPLLAVNRGGPNEHDLEVLADGTVLLVMRYSWDGACTKPVGGPYRNYFAALSKDEARTWSAITEMKNAGCVFPRLLQLDAGPTLLSGGRQCTRKTVDVLLWASDNASDSDSSWSRHSLSFQHNRLWKGEAALRFTPQVNQSDPFSFLTQSYTSLVPLGPKAAIVFYQMYYGNAQGTGAAAFAMRVESVE